ncbi:hypothetical protein OIO90_000965 [Microbotryomycetes sp. JL221]|nr:hypothetical protein OIO90_000965 [Microbotryomycetes sp. JL221]
MTRRIICIGAGPGGLAQLKVLLHFPYRQDDGEPEFDPIVLEQASAIGGTFDQRSYENGCLVSSKQLTAFSDFRFPASAPDHVTMPEYVNYLKRYIVRFGLDSKCGKRWNATPFANQSRIQLETKVTQLERTHDGKHKVTFELKDGQSHTVECDAVAICTGLHVIPAVPDIAGIPQNLSPQSTPIIDDDDDSRPQYPPVSTWPRDKQPRGVRVIHSSQYKRRQEFKDRNVLILGVGETSMDLCYEAIQGGAKQVVVCHRGGFLSFPKVLNDFQVFGIKFDGDLPIDGLITNLFETAYVHPWIRESRLRWHVSDFIIKRVLWFLTGTQAGCNQHVGSLPPSRLGRAYVFLNKSHKAMQYINKPYTKHQQQRWLERWFGTKYIDPPMSDTQCQEIDLALWPSHVDEQGSVHFMKGSELKQSNGIKRIEEVRMRNKVVKPDLVVYATGYRQDWSWLGQGYDKGPLNVDVRGITSSKDVTIGYIGFVRPGVGAIPPIVEIQAMLWSLLLTNRVPIPSEEGNYHLLAPTTARIQYGVDHGAYVSTLARDMGAAPSLWTLYRQFGLHVLLSYCFGASFVPFFRLTGPFAEPVQMSEICKQEIWSTITRRGIIGNLTMGLIPMLFYAVVNLLALLMEQCWKLAGKPKWVVDRIESMSRRAGVTNDQSVYNNKLKMM